METSSQADFQDQVGLSAQAVQSRHGEVWDQRAKDLVDEALGLEPLEAIPLLRKALRYGRTGVQASRAYFVLGMKYEDMGDDKRAVQAYTKSIRAWQPETPSPIALFWRGQIHYRNRRLSRARSDLESALKNGLTSPEREQAERYLEEIGKRGVQ